MGLRRRYPLHRSVTISVVLFLYLLAFLCADCLWLSWQTDPIQRLRSLPPLGVLLFSGPVAVLAASIIILPHIKYRSRKRELSQLELESELYRIDHFLDGHDFEYWCADLLRRNRFHRVTVTRGSGDNGVDILARKGASSYAIQCKHYRRKVGNKAVQEAHAGMLYYRRNTAVVFTNSYYTQQAIDTARKLGVYLWDRDTMVRFMQDQTPAVYQIRSALKSLLATFAAIILSVDLLLPGYAFVFRPLFSDPAPAEPSTTEEQAHSPVQTEPAPPRETQTKVELEGVIYALKDGEATVIDLTAEGETRRSLRILSEVNGAPVTKIGNFAFSQDSSLEEIFIPNTVTYIGDSAFFDCTSLQEIAIPSSVTHLGDGCFFGSGLRSVELPDSITVISATLFADCYSLTSVLIPDSVTAIEKSAFLACEALEDLHIPKSVERISSSTCFAGCKSLKTVYVQEGCTAVDENTFFATLTDTEVIYY